MISINVTSNLEKAIAGLKQFDATQLRYTTARTLTDVAKEVQAEVRSEMPKRFTLRRDWIVKGIRVQYATKDSLRSVVYSKDPFMERQETGGIKGPQQAGGKHVAVPTTAVRRTSKQIIAKADLPANLGNKAFKLQGKDGGLYLAKRFARGKRAGVQVLYALRPQTRVKPRLGLADTARKVIGQRFASIFERNMAQAMATRR